MLIVNAFSAMLALVGLVYLSRNREFELSEMETTINAILFGIFFLFIILVIYTIKNVDVVFHDKIASFVPNISTYLGYLTQITELALIPLFAVCLFISVLLLRDNL